MSRNRRVHEQPVIIVVLALAVSAAVAGISWSGWLEGPENFYDDLWHRLAGLRYQPQNVAIVSLDEATLKQYPEPLVCWTPILPGQLRSCAGPAPGSSAWIISSRSASPTGSNSKPAARQPQSELR